MSSNTPLPTTIHVRVGEMNGVIGDISVGADSQVKYTGRVAELKRLYESVKRQRLYRELTDAEALAQMCRFMRGPVWAKDISDEA